MKISVTNIDRIKMRMKMQMLIFRQYELVLFSCCIA